MGKSTGFLEFDRKTNPAIDPLTRISNYNEFHPGMDRDQRQCQAARCMNCGVPFCTSGMNFGGAGYSGCPLHNVIAEWNDFLYLDNWEHALVRLSKTNNFPEFTGRVCPALCEAACVCGINDAPVTIRENELALVEQGFEQGWIQPVKPATHTGKRVAVVGSGPAGLAVADQLNHRGHGVTVYERADRIGGLLMYGIPNMKLEKHIVDRRVALMGREGIQFMTNADVGVDISAGQLLEEYDAVVLCCGARQPREMQVPGRENTAGVCYAMDFLTASTKNLLDGTAIPAELNAKGKDVIVVGGGDTGNDCLGTALRQDCASLTALDRHPKKPEVRAENNPWPQWPKVCKNDYGHEEATAKFGQDPRRYSSTVKACIADEQGNLQSVVLIQTREVADEAGGKITVQEIPGTEEEVPCQLLLIAGGFQGPEAYVPSAFAVETDRRTNVKTEQGHYATSVDKVFAAGDMRRGQSLVVWAIAEGRACAAEVDAYLMGYTGL